MLDPNCRPGATPDPGAVRARIDRIARRADVVKVSDDDLEFLAPGVPRDATIDRLIGLGARVVLRTNGSDDVEVADDVRAARPCRSPAVEVVDTVGAGDAFGGGFAGRRGRRPVGGATTLRRSTLSATRSEWRFASRRSVARGPGPTRRPWPNWRRSPAERRDGRGAAGPRRPSGVRRAR